MNSELLIGYANSMGITLEEEATSLMVRYGEAILEKNMVINLTAITDENEFLVKHLLDSLTAASLNEVRGKILDVGTGGGFPGVIIKIHDRSREVVVVDSKKKKLSVVEEICKELGIVVDVLHKRVEIMSHEEARQSFDCVVARAVAPMPRLLEYCLGLVKIGGHLLTMKGPDVENEISSASEAERMLGAKLKRVVNFMLPNEIERNIAIYEKIKDTPKKYPRNSASITKAPL